MKEKGGFWVGLSDPRQRRGLNRGGGRWFLVDNSGGEGLDD